jgi:hypothetical protein
VGYGGSFFDLLGRRVGSAEGDVLADGLGEEKCLLRDEADVFAQCGEGVGADGLAIDQYSSGRGIVEAGD